MESTHLLLAQALSLSGLIGASGAYAGIVRRRRDDRLNKKVASVSGAAVQRVERHLAMAHLEHTFTKSAYEPFGGRFSGRTNADRRHD